MPKTGVTKTEPARPGLWVFGAGHRSPATENKAVAPPWR